ncbi:MAG: glycosyltransferase [Cyclobacteriaceae bacterium]
MSKTLVVLTIEYPEPLLDKEIPFLSRAFDKVYVIHASHSQSQDSTPHFGNVESIQLFPSPDFPKTFKLLLKHFRFVARVYLYTLLQTGNFLIYLKHYRSFIGYLLIEAERVKPLEQYIIERKLDQAIFYDYWLVDSTLALSDLKRRKKINTIVARAHGFDLYDERQFEGRVPFVEYRTDSMDKVFAISEHGFSYLKSRLRPTTARKIDLSYLGITSRFITEPKKNEPNLFTIVSCSSLIPLKRVDRIIRILKLMELKINWIHFGDGPQRESLEKDCLELPENIRVSFYGNVDNSKVLEFYSTNFVDLFISMSESEGLPVSMMEAISFGIPILATSVNGVPEIVTVKTGELVDKGESVKEISNLMYQMLSGDNFDRDVIRSFFQSHFDANKNYESFVNKLIEIKE